MCCLGTVDSATDNSGCAGVPGRRPPARAAMRLQWDNIVFMNGKAEGVTGSVS